MRQGRSGRLGRAALWALVVLGVAATPSLASAARDIGHPGPRAAGFGGADGPTAEKPESKLWWNDGFWWASMGHARSGEFRIFRLRNATQTWRPTKTRLDAREKTQADVLWDGRRRKLYVASHEVGSGAGESRLYRYSYNARRNTYSRDRGFPAVINGVKSRALVIDKDSTGQLWATWVQGGNVYVNRSICGRTCNHRRWGEPIDIGDATNDDISALVAFGKKIGVMWSDQAADRFSFAVHRDKRRDMAWRIETAIAKRNIADDHINLKADRKGRVFAAIKTNRHPETRLLVRGAGGRWKGYGFARAHTRPILLLDEANGRIHMLATYPDTGAERAIYRKTSRIGSISFPGGRGTPVLRAAGNVVSDATSTKQSLNGRTDLVVLGFNTDTDRYWHAHRRLP